MLQAILDVIRSLQVVSGSQMADALDIWMNGELVGVWSQTRSGTAVFQYDPSWLRSPQSRPLSLSLPILPGNGAHRGNYVAAWFDNLLPDSAPIRERIRYRFHTASESTFDLLAAIGRDCVGAVQIMPTGEDPGDVKQIVSEALQREEIARLLRGVTVSQGFGFEDTDAFRISIAGAQEKTALLRVGNDWHLPHGPTPTTHILKLPLGLIGNVRADMRDSIENEWLSLNFLSQLGFPVAETEIATFADDVSEERCLIVKRFDRFLVATTPNTAPWILRLPQEDFCQATGTPADRKYEASGGPGIETSLELIAAGENPITDALAFCKIQLAFWLLAAPDGHAKNFSIFLKRQGYALTPFYDVVSAWPVIGHAPNQWPIQKVELAMGLRGKSTHRELNRISVRHWESLALRSGVDNAFGEMVQMVEDANRAMASVIEILPRGFPDYVSEKISEGVKRQRQHFLDVLALKNTPELSTP